MREGSKLCIICGEKTTYRDTESHAQFKQRKTCSHSCGRKLRTITMRKNKALRAASDAESEKASDILMSVFWTNWSPLEKLIQTALSGNSIGFNVRGEA